MHRRRLVKAAVAVLGVGTIFMLASCISFSPFMVREAPLPEGWPTLTPVGEVEVKTYPAYRAATVSTGQAGGGMDPMFNTLFRHIKDEDIPMTAPVDVGYAAESPSAGPVNMAFLYRDPEVGSTGRKGNVQVQDFAPATYASRGMRGDYKTETIAPEIAELKTWLAQQKDWREVGPPRYLGYNGPFILPAFRYGEVQIPVEPVNAAPDQP